MLFAERAQKENVVPFVIFIAGVMNQSLFAPFVAYMQHPNLVPPCAVNPFAVPFWNAMYEPVYPLLVNDTFWIPPVAKPSPSHVWQGAKLSTAHAVHDSKSYVNILSLLLVPVCVTLIVMEVAPFPETVIVALRCEADVLAEAVAVIVPLLEPDAGLIVNQLADEVAVHEVLLVTVMVLLPPLAV